LTFDQVAEELFEEMIEDNFQFYKHVTDDSTLKTRFFDWLFEQYAKGTQGTGKRD
jgi:type I restriction enzyme R subunit